MTKFADVFQGTSSAQFPHKVKLMCSVGANAYIVTEDNDIYFAVQDSKDTIHFGLIQYISQPPHRHKRPITSLTARLRNIVISCGSDLLLQTTNTDYIPVFSSPNRGVITHSAISDPARIAVVVNERHVFVKHEGLHGLPARFELVTGNSPFGDQTVKQILIGNNHVAVLTNENELYAMGSGPIASAGLVLPELTKINLLYDGPCTLIGSPDQLFVFHPLINKLYGCGANKNSSILPGCTPKFSQFVEISLPESPYPECTQSHLSISLGTHPSLVYEKCGLVYTRILGVWKLSNKRNPLAGTFDHITGLYSTVLSISSPFTILSAPDQCTQFADLIISTEQ